MRNKDITLNLTLEQAELLLEELVTNNLKWVSKWKNCPDDSPYKIVLTERVNKLRRIENTLCCILDLQNNTISDELSDYKIYREEYIKESETKSAEESEFIENHIKTLESLTTKELQKERNKRMSANKKAQKDINKAESIITGATLIIKENYKEKDIIDNILDNRKHKRIN